MPRIDVRGKNVIVFGDSLSTRWGKGSHQKALRVTETDTTRPSSPGDYFASWLVRAGAHSVILNAKGGRSAYTFFSSTVEDGPGQLRTLVATSPDIVFIILGTNDAYFKPSMMGVSEQRLRKIVSAFKKAGAEVWIVGPPYLPGEGTKTIPTQVIAYEKRVAGRRFIDMRPLTVDMKPGMAGRSGDGVHFTAAGARVLAQRLADTTNIMRPLAMSPGFKVGVASLAFTALGLGVSFIVARRNELAS